MNTELTKTDIQAGKTLKLIGGDITQEKVNAIVNAANSQLQHGGGVAGVIARKGGKIIQEESNKIGFVPVGEAALTTGGDLKAGSVIHAVGPRWGEGDEDEKLQNAVTNSLKLAEKEQFNSISMPAISAGIFGFPKDRCARIMLNTIRDYLQKHQKGSLKEVRICLFDQPTRQAFEDEFDRLFE